MGIFGNVQLPDDDTVMKAAREALTHPPDSWFGNDDLFVTWGLTIGRTRDSDLADISNFERVSEDMSRVFPADVDFVHSSHWACGWTDELQVRVLEPWADPDDYAVRDITRAFKVITAIAVSLRDQYPLYDDTDYSRRESEQNEENREEAWADVRHELWWAHDVEDADVTEADRAVFDDAWSEAQDNYGYSEAWVDRVAVAVSIMDARNDKS